MAHKHIRDGWFQRRRHLEPGIHLLTLLAVTTTMMNQARVLPNIVYRELSNHKYDILRSTRLTSMQQSPGGLHMPLAYMLHIHPTTSNLWHFSANLQQKMQE